MTESSLSEIQDTAIKRAAFIEHVRDNPNDRRMSNAAKTTMIGWLTGEESKPTSQRDSNRRNYVKKAFACRDNTQELFAMPRRQGQTERLVITEDQIVDVVEAVHEQNGHAGWDKTWEDVSRNYYGILRADVIFILKRCVPCAQNPRKRPKSFLSTSVHGEQDHDGFRHPCYDEQTIDQFHYDSATPSR